MGHPPRIPVWLDHDQPVIYFLTFCVADRRPVLANDQTFAAFADVVQKLGNWKIIAAILMPDHVHLLAAPDNRDAEVGELSAGIKRAVRKRVQANWQWQPGCFDRLLRSDESAEEKWNYIRENPVRAGLVDHWPRWPDRMGFEL